MIDTSLKRRSREREGEKERERERERKKYNESRKIQKRIKNTVVKSCDFRQRSRRKVEKGTSKKILKKY